MFQVGDKIVYPMHGAGIIEAIEEKEILGEKQHYYLINMPMGNVHIMIPMEKVMNLGIREIVDRDTMDDVLHTFHDHKSDSSVAWNQRYRKNMDKLKTGDIYKGAEVIRDLLRINKDRVLGAGEKKMLDNAMQMFISELVSVKKITEEQATDLVNQFLHKDA
ncbi:CarD family transcriptional regulator [Salinithrix halophila]|uniref:CarD family transcriptional regulator n=1 Tax=Salinithrix halophila TaxID=1485204 RepID=A0ABV8JE93_9BACL